AAGDDHRPGRRSGPPRRVPRPAVLLAPVPHPAWGEPVGASGAAPLSGGRSSAERTRGRIVRVRATFRRELVRSLTIPDRRGGGAIRQQPRPELLPVGRSPHVDPALAPSAMTAGSRRSAPR